MTTCKVDGCKAGATADLFADGSRLGSFCDSHGFKALESGAADDTATIGGDILIPVVTIALDVTEVRRCHCDDCAARVAWMTEGPEWAPTEADLEAAQEVSHV